MSSSEHQTVELTSTSSFSSPSTTATFPPPASAADPLPATPLPLLGSQSFATSASWTVNILLTIAKIIVFISSRSKAVLASLADSIVDLASQGILSLAERYMKRHDARYPVGRARLEALGVLGCACVMCLASVEVIQFSAIDLYTGFHGKKPLLELGPTMYTVLSIGTAAKLVLYIICRAANARVSSDIMQALAEDHLNDVFSNSAAIIAGTIASKISAVWWIDPAAGIAISALIIVRWIGVVWDQVKKVTGFTAPPEFVDRVNAIAAEHSAFLSVDCTRAYHFGSRFNVEMEIVLPHDMTVMESHDIALALQHKIEADVEVERAFVHVDYQIRDGLEHKVERELFLGHAESSSSSATAAPAGQGGLAHRRIVSGGVGDTVMSEVSSAPRRGDYFLLNKI